MPGKSEPTVNATSKPPHPSLKARIRAARKKRRPTRALVEAARKFQTPAK